MTHAIRSTSRGPRKSAARRAAALPSDCSAAPLRRTPIDADIARTPRVAIGAFRCPVTWPAFRDTGPIPECVVAFPRSGVFIQHEGSVRFLADPTVVTIYNRNQRYERFAASPDGDRCDWFAVSDEIAREIAVTFDGEAHDRERPFRFQWAPSTPELYARQRRIGRRAARGMMDPLELEEEVVGVVESVLSLAHRRPRRGPRAVATRRRWVELADAARTELLATLDQNRSVHDLARSLCVSPFHLCRVFRAITGKTLHEYRRELRIRHALEWLASTRKVGLSTVAHGLGFSSHSHFVREMRSQLGATPSALRRSLS